MSITKDRQYYKFCSYGFLKNLRFFDAFFLLYLKQSGLSYTEIGSLYATREMLTYFAEVPTGIIADTFGRKNSLIFSFLTYIVSFLLFWQGGNYWIFFSSFVLYGIADAFRSGTHKAMIMDYLAHQNQSAQKVDYYGHTRACSQRGSAISALAAGLIVFYTGNYSFIFLLSIIPYLINFFLILSYPSYLNLTSKKKRKNLKTGVKILWQSVKMPQTFAIIHSAAVFTAYQKAIKDYIQPVMKNLALVIPVFIGWQCDKRTGLLIGVMYFVLYLITASASTYAGKIASRFTGAAGKTLQIGLGLGILAGILFHWHILSVSLLAFMGIYAIESIRKPILTGSLSDAVPNDILASVLSAQSLYRSLLTAVLSLGFGYFSDLWGMGYALAGISLVLLVIGMGRMRRDLL